MQFLAGKGFKNIYNMKGGIKAWNGLEVSGPIELGIVGLKGNESSQEILTFAYGMEDGLNLLYRSLAERIDDKETIDLLITLAGFEENHKNKLFNLYKTYDMNILDEDAFSKNIVSDVMEGGFTVNEFIDKNSSSLKTVSGVLNMAMMLETQALDLYLRYSHMFTDEKEKKILQNIADEEKSHLISLGRLMDKSHDK